MMSKPSQEEELEAQTEESLMGRGSFAWLSGGLPDSVSRRGISATVAGAEHIPDVSELSNFLVDSIL